MNRRGFMKGFLAATATVAIGLRMAHKFPIADLKDAIKTWRWENATENYAYGMDTARPWDFQVLKKTEGGWFQISIDDVLDRAMHALTGVEPVEAYVNEPVSKQLMEEVGFEENEEMEVASIIAMSQGMAALNLTGGAVTGYDFGLSEFHDMKVVVPRISRTREELFVHG